MVVGRLEGKRRRGRQRHGRMDVVTGDTRLTLAEIRDAVHRNRREWRRMVDALAKVFFYIHMILPRCQKQKFGR